MTSIQIEWNRGTPDVTRPGSVRLSARGGETFEAGDVVDVTAFGSGSDRCSGKATSVTRATVVDLEFSACGVMLWDVQRVAVSVSEEATDKSYASRAGTLRVSPASFTGPVLQRDATVKPSYSISSQAGVEGLTTLRLSVGDATIDQLVGTRLISILSAAGEEPTIYSGTVGTTSNNQGIWVETDSRTAKPVVVADMIRLAGGRAPRVIGSTQYRMVLVQSQRLGTGQDNLDQHAIITADGTIEG
ncbi:MAG: hypothetical protein ABIS84_15665 [Arachnia sp.]